MSCSTRSPVKMSIETLKRSMNEDILTLREVFDESTGTILEEVERMRRIITEFRDFARLPAPRRQQIDLSSLLKAVVTLHRDVVSEIEVRWDGVEDVAVSQTLAR